MCSEINDLYGISVVRTTRLNSVMTSFIAKDKLLHKNV